MITTSPTASTPKTRLWIEFLLLYVGSPLLMVATFGMFPFFPVLIGFALLAALLLQFTPGWRWRMLLRGPVFGEWRIILIFTAITALFSILIVQALIPQQFLSMPTYRPGLWLMIMLLYPILSAFPQEIIFRSLFFERYGALFPNANVAIVMNGVVFALGHLFFFNWVTILMTGIGGAIMGWAYLRNRTIGLPLVLHGVAGQIIFTVGLGIYFYHGAIGHAP